MILIVGLGNPGKKYEKTRHNVGFRVVDELRSSPHASSLERVRKNFNSFDFANARVIDELAKQKTRKFIIAKPQTFMNESGKAVKKLYTKYKIQNTNLWIIHDDIDLLLGEFKISKGRGSAGHKGVQSIINELGTKDFWRVRIGICPKAGKPKAVENFVLQKFTKEEEKILKEVILKAIEEINEIARK